MSVLNFIHSAGHMISVFFEIELKWHSSIVFSKMPENADCNEHLPIFGAENAKNCEKIPLL